MNPCLLAVALLQVGSPVDEGVLVVRVDTIEVARESFRLTHGRLSRGDIGWTLATTIRYDRSRPVIVLAPILEVNGATMPATLQYDVADPRQPSRILGELGRGRFTVRQVARATERAREFPTGARAVVLDDVESRSRAPPSHSGNSRRSGRRPPLAGWVQPPDEARNSLAQPHRRASRRQLTLL